MATEFTIVPASLNLIVCKGDEFGLTADFDIDLTGYSNWEGIIFKTARKVTSDFPGGVNTQGATAETFTVAVTSASLGKISMALTETQTTGLDEASTYRWFLRGQAPGAVTRTWISGSFSVRSP